MLRDFQLTAFSFASLMLSLLLLQQHIGAVICPPTFHEHYRGPYSFLILLVNIIRSIEETLLSAYIATVEFLTASSRSYNGSKHDSRGTLSFASFHLDLVPFTEQYCLRFEWYILNHGNSLPCIRSVLIFETESYDPPYVNRTKPTRIL